MRTKNAFVVIRRSRCGGLGASCTGQPGATLTLRLHLSFGSGCPVGDVAGQGGSQTTRTAWAGSLAFARGCDPRVPPFYKRGSHPTCFSLTDWLVLGAARGLLQPPALDPLEAQVGSRWRWEPANKQRCLNILVSVEKTSRSFSEHFKGLPPRWPSGNLGWKGGGYLSVFLNPEGSGHA